MSAPLLEVRDLRVHFGARARWLDRRESGVARAVDGVSFALERGQSLGIAGESGCGKSTLARALAGLVCPTAGSILVAGTDVTALRGKARSEHCRRLQMVFQDAGASLDPRLEIGDAVTEPLDVHALGAPRERRARALAALDAVGLDLKAWRRRPHELSGGQRQRVAIARALALGPEILVCDEPTSALDVSVRAQIVNLVADLRERFGLALIWISHDLGVLRHLCERVAVMYLGRIVEEGAGAAVLGSPRHPYTRALLDAVPVADPERERSREHAALAGEPPSPLYPPSGCAFHPRCPERARVADDRCALERPELLPAAGRDVACHLEL